METNVSNLSAPARPCRNVTDEEIAHYQEFGWVKLKQFIARETVTALLVRATAMMGEDGDGNAPYGIDQLYFNAQAASGYDNPAIRPMIEDIGGTGKALMARKADYGIRLFNDFFAPKLPAAKKTRNMGNGPTSFHQDFITFGVDRSGGMTFWIPLEAYGREAGTMSFYEKSHKLGVLGNYTSYDGRSINEVFPDLDGLTVTEPIDYEVGDVTVHNHLMVHGAGANMLDRPRWAYLVLLQPADARWTGAPPEAFDPEAHAMTPYGKFPNATFPIIA